MSEGGNEVIALLSLAIPLTVGFVVAVAITVRHSSPWWISQQLQRGTPRITRRTRYSTGTWNPARPFGPNNHIGNEPGQATYTLTDDGLIRLDLIGRNGRREQHVGPPVERTPRQRAVWLAVLAGVLIYPAGIALGAGVGSIMGHGGQGVAIGALAGFIFAWLAAQIASAYGRARLARSDRTSPPGG